MGRESHELSTSSDIPALQGRVLGIDPGDVRLGVAVSDELGMLAHPLETVDVRKTDPVARIAALSSEKSAVRIVVGLPRNMDGTSGSASEKARALAEKLRAALPAIPVELWDERLTTVAASRALRESGKSARNQKGLIDQMAALIILQSWLDSR